MGDTWFERIYLYSENDVGQIIMDFVREQNGGQSLHYRDIRLRVRQLFNNWLDGAGSAHEQVAEYCLRKLGEEYDWFPEVSGPLKRDLQALREGNVGPLEAGWLDVVFDRGLKPIEILQSAASYRSLMESAAAVKRAFPAEWAVDEAALRKQYARLERRRQEIAPAVAAGSAEGGHLLRDFGRQCMELRREIWYSLGALRKATEDAKTVDLRAEWEDQARVIRREMDRMEWYRALSGHEYDRQAMILDTDRDVVDVVLRRTGALLSRLEKMGAGERLGTCRSRLDTLARKAEVIGVELLDARMTIYMALCRLRREIAFCNPLLDFDRIVFVKHNHTPLYVRAHHQFLGYAGEWARGGLFVLGKPFSSTPVVRNLLAQSACEGGLRKGATLDGTFLSPEVSYDARQVYFAFAEIPVRGERGQFQQDPERQQYKIFRVNADGSGLVQLTEGPFNDFDPCPLPDGSLVFVSTRRGGFTMGDTNGPNDVFTLWRMDPATGRIGMLSPHMDHEWNPAVSHDGNILYTRWDIWDRGYTSGQGLWQAMPDGRNPRAIVDNYRSFAGFMPGSPPNQIMDCRPVPGSTKLMATSISYFDPSFGCIILIDPSIPDNGLHSSLKRLTPDQLFPSGECGRNLGPMQYGTPWPLSEQFFLCVYDSRHDVAKGPDNNFGIYLADAFGNRELLYRDPDVSCFRPVPLAPRPVPPIVPDQLPINSLPVSTSDSAAADAGAVIGVVDVRESLLAFPPDVPPARLRIVRALPKTTPGFERPAMGYGANKGGRMVIGTVPIESDGSAYFELPKEGVNSPISFQVLDGNGLAIQVMRELTYAKSGERLVCLGCHEPTSRAPYPRDQYPKAFLRAPSKVEPDVDGGEAPLTFPRLVQPILDKHCVDCHARNAGKAPDLSRGDWPNHPSKFYTSYVNLEKYVNCFKSHNGEPTRTVPGAFGARASRLCEILENGHHDVQLSDEEMHKIALWIDCNARFFGTYDEMEKQSRGEVVMPSLR